MNTVRYAFTLDVTKNGVQGTLSGMRSGEMRCRRLVMSLCYGKDSIKMNGNEVAYMFVTRPSDSTPSIEGCIIDGNNIIYEISNNDVAEEGTVKLQLKIVGSRPAVIDGKVTTEDVILYAPVFEMEVTNPDVDESHAPSEPIYTALETLLTEFTSRTFDAEAYAVGERNGIPVPYGDPAYHNNAKYYKDIIVEEAGEVAREWMETSEAYAVGTRDSIPVSEGDEAYHNNSKWYSEQASASASSSATSAVNAQNSANYANSRVSEIEGIKNQTEAIKAQTEAIRVATEGYKDSASASKNSAERSAIDAQTYASSASSSASVAESYASEATQTIDTVRGYATSASASASSASASAIKSENEADRSKNEADRASSIASSVTPTKMTYDEETKTLAFEDIAGIGGVIEDITELNSKVDRLTDEVSKRALQTSLDKTNRSLDYLWKKSKGIIYDTETVTSNADVTVPSGAMGYAELQKLGGVSRKGETTSLIDAKVDEVVSRGKNLLDMSEYIGNILTSGEKKLKCPKFKRGTYTFSLLIGNGASGGGITFALRDANRNVIKSVILQNAILKRIELSAEEAHKITSLDAYPFSQSVGTVLNWVQIEENVVATPYVPYIEPITTTIPTSILSLPDYGIGVSADCYNYVDFVEKKYHHLVTVVDGEMVQLAEEEIIDISDLIDEDFNILSVESGGKVEFNYPSKAEYECETPNEIEYMVEVAKVE